MLVKKLIYIIVLSIVIQLYNNKTNAASPVRTQKSRDFTVDIFTPKSSEAKDGEEEKKVEEVEEVAKKVGGGVAAPDKVHNRHLSLSL